MATSAQVDTDNSWRTPQFRQGMVSKLEEAIRRSGVKPFGTSVEMEFDAFRGATSKEAYVNYVVGVVAAISHIPAMGAGLRGRKGRGGVGGGTAGGISFDVQGGVAGPPSTARRPGKTGRGRIKPGGWAGPVGGSVGVPGGAGGPTLGVAGEGGAAGGSGGGPRVSDSDPTSDPPGPEVSEGERVFHQLSSIMKPMLVDLSTNIEQLFTTAWTNEAVRDLTWKPSASGEKSLRLANQLQKKADREMKRGKLKQAFEDYSSCLTLCPSALPEENRKGPCDPSGISIVYAKRSLVHFQLERYHYCIFDIMQALRFQYPPANEFELFERMGQCNEKLNEFDKARQLYEYALTLCKAREYGDTIKRLKSSLNRVEELRRSKKAPASILNVQHDPKRFRDVPELSYGVSAENASASVAVRFIGDGWFATRDIRPGDVILVEVAYGYDIGGERHHRTCAHCSNSIVSSTPCSGCSLVSYCNQKCQREAWDMYHSVECELVPLIEPFRGVSLFRLLVRVVIKFVVDVCRATSSATDLPAGAKQIADLVSKARDRFAAAPDSADVHFGPVFFTIYALIINKILLRSIYFIDLTLEQLAAISELINAGASSARGGIYDTSEASQMTESTDIALGILLSQVLQACIPISRRIMIYQNMDGLYSFDKVNSGINPPCSVTGGAHAFKSSLCSSHGEPAKDDSASTDANSSCGFGPASFINSVADASFGLWPSGLAFYAHLSSIKHSCFPNVADVYYGTTCVVKALRHVRKGEEIVMCRVGKLTAMNFHERRTVLRSKLIDCRCDACTNQLSAADLSEEPPLLRCPHCGSAVVTRRKCQKCSRDISVEMQSFQSQWRLLSLGFDQWMKPTNDGDKPEQDSFLVDLVSSIDASIFDAHRCAPYIRLLEKLHIYFQKMASVDIFARKPLRNQRHGSPKPGEVDSPSAFVDSFYSLRF